VTLRLFGSFALAAIAGLALTINAFVESFHSARLGVVLVILVLLHLLRYPRIVFSREFALYFIFLGYMIVALLWTANVDLAMNTLEPAVDFALVLILFGSLATYHDLRAVLAGTFGGFLTGAAVYTFTTGFPFVYPGDFSYNAISEMYLFGLFITLAFGWYTRSRVLSLSIGLVLLVLITTTTSIKTNLGIVLGATASGLMYFKPFLRGLRRNTIPLVALAGMIAYAVVSSDALVERLQAGVDRVALGVEVLNADSELTGYSGFEERKDWIEEGLKGATRKPLLGHGVEAFRDRYGITSHSTPADLLYNSGIVGFVLFYAIFISIAWRLARASDTNLGNFRALVFGALICYLFISLSAPLHYNAFFAVYIAISTTLLARQRSQPRSGFSSIDEHA
jgi:hypothetical protein